ncbi:hypothetical protein [Arthrobacter sp. 35W]|uniref:hypothetical protein n=1 Tax=Arthrobacter sp. 35W TaxID=1132441 RepID=UPI0003F4BD48|nr:hypothetical protein [Arthrobacter sp. 35W]
MRGLKELLRLSVVRARHGQLFIDALSLQTTYLALWLAAVVGVCSWSTGEAGEPGLQMGIAYLGTTIAAFLVANRAGKGTATAAATIALQALWLALSLLSALLLAAHLSGGLLLAGMVIDVVMTQTGAYLVVQRGLLAHYVILSLANLAASILAYARVPDATVQGTIVLVFAGAVPAVAGTMAALQTLSSAMTMHAVEIDKRISAVAARLERQTIAERLAIENRYQQLECLLRRTAQVDSLPLSEEMAAEAAACAAELRRALLLRSSSTWVGRVLAEQPGFDRVSIIDPDRVADRIDLGHRAAIAAVSLLLSSHNIHDPQQRLRLWIERRDLVGKAAEVRLTWRVATMRKSELPSLVWTELGKVGRFAVDADPAGLTVHLRCQHSSPGGIDD